MTRRFVALCLALLLPLQFAWGAAAVYCQHEAAPKLGSHFGHHAHVHEGGAQDSAGAKATVHADCGDCNAATPQPVSNPIAEVTALPAASYAGALPRLAPRSAPTREPDRPQWLRLA